MVLDEGVMIYVTVDDGTDHLTISEVYLFEGPITPLPTFSPTGSPTTSTPTTSPSTSGTSSPSTSPTTDAPTTAPSKNPTNAPTTKAPTEVPSGSPTESPSQDPSSSPSKSPSTTPTTGAPTTATTDAPTTADPTTVTQTPTSAPTTTSPTTSPNTAAPTSGPTTGTPTTTPPTNAPITNTPTKAPISTTTKSPTKNPTYTPTENPTITGGEGGVGEPTAAPLNDAAIATNDGKGLDTDSVLMLIIIILLILILCGCILVFFKKLKMYWALRDKYETFHYNKYNDVSPVEDSGAGKPMMIDINYANGNANTEELANGNGIEEDQSPRRQSRAEGGALTVPEQIGRHDSDDDIMDGDIETRIEPDKDTPNALPPPPRRKGSPRKGGKPNGKQHSDDQFIDALIQRPQPPMVPLRDIQRIQSSNNDNPNVNNNSYDQDEDAALMDNDDNDENKQYEDDNDVMMVNGDGVTIDGIEHKLNDEDDYDDFDEGLNKQKSYHTDRNGDLIIDEDMELDEIDYNNINAKIKRKTNKKKKESESESYIINGSESETTR
eukprot:CAMPEP_0201595312 /NCGR_PEP_ID=MMETSP0190_2-20130828/192355_1 /ASSEMBLY_ACC=CAM_ASM_000263 /TAXON_ID=37353 /ORGANISM="Rosalina sp." /LENGTH=549 /DNA_ID=CAMNT_0048055251 /DNA_START=59 /DNA_END=1708 /DNA_ORIENTATION=+